MNPKTAPWLAIILTAAVGILFIVWHNEVNLFSWLIRALGLVIVIPGAYLLVNAIGPEKSSVTIQTGSKKPVTLGNRSSSVSLTIVSVIAILLGLWMLAAPGFFVGLIAYLFAAALFIYGGYQTFTILYLNRSVMMPWYYYLIPTLSMLVAIIIAFTPVHAMNTIVTLLTGLLLIFSAINWILQRVAIHNFRKNELKRLEPGNDA